MSNLSFKPIVVAIVVIVFVVLLISLLPPPSMSVEQRREKVRVSVSEFMAGKAIDPYRIPGWKGGYYDLSILESNLAEGTITQEEFDAIRRAEFVVRRRP